MDTLFKDDGMTFWQRFWKDCGRKDKTLNFSDMILSSGIQQSWVYLKESFWLVGCWPKHLESSLSLDCGNRAVKSVWSQSKAMGASQFQITQLISVSSFSRQPAKKLIL